jgi:hypothetical protein
VLHGISRHNQRCRPNLRPPDLPEHTAVSVVEKEAVEVEAHAPGANRFCGRGLDVVEAEGHAAVVDADS